MGYNTVDELCTSAMLSIARRCHGRSRLRWLPRTPLFKWITTGAGSRTAADRATIADTSGERKAHLTRGRPLSV